MYIREKKGKVTRGEASKLYTGHNEKNLYKQGGEP